MKILITGASGFIGKKLLDVLKNNPKYHIRVLSRKEESFFPHNVEVIPGDLISENCPCDKLVKGCSIIIHCAGEIHNELLMTPLHVIGTKRLLSAALKAAKASQEPIHWVQLSSVGAYGPPQNHPSEERIITEETLPHPQGEYERTKTLSDNLIIEANREPFFSYTILRPSNVFGEGMPNNSLRQLAAIIKKELFFYIGKPGAIVPYIHVDDVVKALIACAFSDNAKGEIFNISNDCLLEDLIETMAHSLNIPTPKIRIPDNIVRTIVRLIGKWSRFPLTETRINALISRSHYPYTKIQNVLKITPSISILDTIDAIIAKRDKNEQ